MHARLKFPQHAEASATVTLIGCLHSLQVSALTGGISNSLYKVTASDKVDREHVTVVVRVYADYPVPTHVDREREQQVLISLNSIGFGAQVRIIPTAPW